MRVSRSFRPIAEALGVIALCSGLGTMIATAPMPESNGTPLGGFLEPSGAPGVETAPAPSVDLGLVGILPASGDAVPHPINPVDDYDALYAAMHPTDPTPMAPAGAFD